MPAIKCCPECEGQGVVNVTVGSLGPECDLCPTCGGTGTVATDAVRPRGVHMLGAPAP